MLGRMGSVFDKFKDWFDDLSDVRAFWFIFVVVLISLGFIALLAAISPVALAVFGIIILVACFAGVISFGILMMVREDL